MTFQGTEPCEVLLLKGLDQFPFPTKRTAFEMLGGYLGRIALASRRRRLAHSDNSMPDFIRAKPIAARFFTRSRCVRAACAGVLVVGVLAIVAPALARDYRGEQFIGLTKFSSLARSDSEIPGEQVLTSPEIRCRIHWNELIASWNAQTSAEGYVKVEARAISKDGPTKYYVLGDWSPDPSRHPRQSVPNQKDADGDVATDTLVLNRPADRVQIRITLGGGVHPELRFLGLSLADTKVAPPALEPNRSAWGTLIPVPERSQMLYPNGQTLCSPTTVSMLLGFWSERLVRPELDRTVPEVARGVDDPNWQGTGNWPFNMAFAGSLPGLRAYVARFSDVSELEDWVGQGLPVGLSVCYNKLRGLPGPRSGHLVVCVGFTKTGDVVINDPGTRVNVRKTFSRANLIAAWAQSHNTVYLVYPTDQKPPRDRFGHWCR